MKSLKKEEKLKMNFWSRPCANVGDSPFLAIMHKNDAAWVPSWFLVALFRLL